jgi:carboxylesterase type B
VVALHYITLQGSTSSATNMTFYSRIPFASPPERFQPPQPPQDISSAGIYHAARTFDLCPQRASNGSEAASSRATRTCAP